MRLYRLAKAVDADAYHCNEVDSWAIGVLLRLTTGRKCLVDIHEHYPSTFAETRFPRWLQPAAASAVRCCYMLLAPFTTSIVLAKQSVASDFWFAKSKIVLVQNFARLSALRPTQESASPISSKAEAPTLVHLGLLSRARGWPQLLDAIKLLKNDEVRLHIIGEFHDGTEDAFFTQAKELGVQHRIVFDQWMPFDDAFRCLLKAHVGLILFQPGIQNHVFALPHKMFDYMLAELPFIAPSFAEEVQEIVKNSGAGLLVDPTRPEEIAEAVDRILQDPVLSQTLGTRGREAVLETYNWEAEAAKLLRTYEELLLVPTAT